MSVPDTAWRIVDGDLTHPDVRALVELHVRAAHANSPPGHAFALDLSELRAPAVRLWTMWDGDMLLGMGALTRIDAATGEIKSMRTVSTQQRRGVARGLLGHLVAEARASGWRELKLETGANDAFAPARALYERAGFRPAAPFGDYTLTDFNRCYALPL